MQLYFLIAIRHLLARKRQSFVSLSGIVIGVAFFLSISSMMQGSEQDFIKRLVDNAPHVTISDSFRTSREQAVSMRNPDAQIEILHITPLTETRGIRGYRTILQYLSGIDGVRSSAVLLGQVLLSYAGRERSINLNGMIPFDIADVTTIQEHMVEGSIDDLIADRNGVILGRVLIKQLGLRVGSSVTFSSASGQRRVFRIVGSFHTGRADYDESQAFVDIKRVQALLDRRDRVNSIIIKLEKEQKARTLAGDLEERFGYRAVSWQEANENILSTFVVRNTIMYVVVSAVLLVAAFGIYNTISTVVIEKYRDIAILRSIGFLSRDIKIIFIIQGFVLGSMGVLMGLPLGSLMIIGLGQITFRAPNIDPLQIPMDWSVLTFGIAGGFAMSAAMIAAWLPSEKAAEVEPVSILRGGQ
jgi:lipoprotein-releasing system permease protein